MSEARHGCGGTLVVTPVTIEHREGGLLTSFRVEGLVCQKCGVELVDRDTALALEQALATQSPQVFILVDDHTFRASDVSDVWESQSATSATSLITA